MASFNVKAEWKGDDAIRALTDSLGAGLRDAALVMANHAVQNMGSEGGGIAGSGSRIDVDTGRRIGRINIRRKGRKSHRWVPSPPGAFPGIRDRLLTNSIRYAGPKALGPLKAGFGTAVEYGRHLELGRSEKRARPWVVRSAMMAQEQAMRILTATVKRELTRRAGGGV
jgi:hypothetical protein